MFFVDLSFNVMYSATLLEHAPLEAVYIYFDTATYDEIKRDEKVLFWIHLFFGRHSMFMTYSQMLGKVEHGLPAKI